MNDKKYEKICKKLEDLIQLVSEETVPLKQIEFKHLKDKLHSAKQILINNHCFFVKSCTTCRDYSSDGKSMTVCDECIDMCHWRAK